MVQHLTKSTSTAACYLLLGAIPIEGTIHQKALTLFGNIMRRSDSIEYEIMERQLGKKEDSANSWAIYIKKLLLMYDLPSICTLLYKPPSKAKMEKDDH